MFSPGIDLVGGEFYGRSIATQRDLQRFTAAGEKPDVTATPRGFFDDSVQVTESKSNANGPSVTLFDRREGATNHANAVKGAEQDYGQARDARKASAQSDEARRETRKLVQDNARDRKIFDEKMVENGKV